VKVTQSKALLAEEGLQLDTLEVTGKGKFELDKREIKLRV
jgi:hypothetical protein